MVMGWDLHSIRYIDSIAQHTPKKKKKKKKKKRSKFFHHPFHSTRNLNFLFFFLSFDQKISDTSSLTGN